MPEICRFYGIVIRMFRIRKIDDTAFDIDVTAPTFYKTEDGTK